MALFLESGGTREENAWKAVAGLFGGPLNFLGTDLAHVAGADAYVVGLEATSRVARWSATSGDTGSQRIAEIAITSADELVVVGSFQGTMSFGGDSISVGDFEDVYISRLTWGLEPVLP